jgi:hypothetical protein
LPEAPIPCEDLDAMIVGIGDVEALVLVDYDTARLPEFPDFATFLTEDDGSAIGTGFNRGQERGLPQQDTGEHATKKADKTSTTGTPHGLIHDHELRQARPIHSERRGQGDLARSNTESSTGA